MISAKFMGSKNQIISFEISGHAGYDEEGYDIVCSAVSALSIGIGNGILEVLKFNADYLMEDGFLSMSLKNLSKEEINECQVLLKTLLLALKNIELSYKPYIEVIEEEV